MKFTEYSLDLEVLAYINITDYAEYLEVAEDLNLRMMEVISTVGTRLAIHAQIEY